MSTTEWLKKMDLGQLRFAKEEAERMINAIESEKKVTLFIVEGPHINEACFTENEFDLAKVKLCEIIMSAEFEPDFMSSDHPKILRRKFFESEAKEMMGLNK